MHYHKFEIEFVDVMLCNFWRSLHFIDLNVMMLCISAQCKSVWKPHANLPDNPVNHTSAANHFQICWGPPGAKQSALRLYHSILRCFFPDNQILELLRPQRRYMGDIESSWNLCAALQETWCHILTAVVHTVPQPQFIWSIIFIFVTVKRFATS